MIPPRVFISYSHDTAEHKGWVLNLATTLRNRGIDAVLDQWDLKPGDDLPHFMETELAKSEFVIMVCTEKYVAKANAGEGGVGYEKMIITSSLLKKIDSNKIIPIIRQHGSESLPTFLKTKIYIDFSKDEDIEYSLDELLRTLMNAPLFEKPDIGSNPFQSFENARPDRTADGIKEIMSAIARAFQGSANSSVTVSQILPFINMHRLSFDRYVRKAIKAGLIDEELPGWYMVSDNGYKYLVIHGVIEEK
jgi:TIR domain